MPLLITTPESAPRRLFHLPFPRHNRTVFVEIDTSRCLTGGQCVSACPHGGLGIISFFRHRHVHVDRALACKGCRKCVKACQQGAIQLRTDVRRKASNAAASHPTLNPVAKGTPLAH
jgi:formate hydrogenlyase subunit 6/NADH:ubiquinone oxidoreductase subunit I